ncbi:hypothetical protein Amsp01_066960 [Amycolatopsis sp. NBRC 101858]|uniref:pentapeptide repeat-containing protein n=1 Tax=Amycolatopsis sp. NBRC 101858 TaxID=3032200 RepID=UPI0024A4098E|nr:pentapeptide repeat-containing protein [Amycolatopsis sp. NBRC 101858]GLY40673.1 hypothetical protein Amsp01_066960 [Amycolatopsis sp. NBRC 101858]
MSTVTPFAVLALIGAVSGGVTAWLILRRSPPVQVLTPPVPEVIVRPTADHSARVAELAHLAELADVDPARRQDFVDRFLARLGCGWRDTGDEVWPVLLRHLRPGSPRFWPGIDLRGDSAVLPGVDLRGCEVRNAIFHEVRFHGDARFDGTVFTGLVSFEDSSFARHAHFGDARFETGADFGNTTFSGTAEFAGATSAAETWFDEARFSARTEFTGARFADTSFANTGFAGRTSFRDARFADAFFGGARFGGHADFTGTSAERFRFPGARARTDVHVRRTWPAGWVLGPPRPLKPGQWAEVVSGKPG